MLHGEPEGFLVIPYSVSYWRKIGNCNTTWIPAAHAQSIALRGDLMNLAPNSEPVQSTAKLTIRLVYEDGSPVPREFYLWQDFCILAPRPAKVEFDIRDETGDQKHEFGDLQRMPMSWRRHRVWFEGACTCRVVVRQRRPWSPDTQNVFWEKKRRHSTERSSIALGRAIVAQKPTKRPGVSEHKVFVTPEKYYFPCGSTYAKYAKNKLICTEIDTEVTVCDVLPCAVPPQCHKFLTINTRSFTLSFHCSFRRACARLSAA